MTRGETVLLLLLLLLLLFRCTAIFLVPLH